MAVDFGAMGKDWRVDKHPPVPSGFRASALRWARSWSSWGSPRCGSGVRPTNSQVIDGRGPGRYQPAGSAGDRDHSDLGQPGAAGRGRASPADHRPPGPIPARVRRGSRTGGGGEPVRPTNGLPPGAQCPTSTSSTRRPNWCLASRERVIAALRPKALAIAAARAAGAHPYNVDTPDHTAKFEPCLAPRRC